MRSSRLSVSLSAGIAIIAAIFAGALIWLLLSDPITVADAVETGDSRRCFPALAVIYQAFLNLLIICRHLSVRSVSQPGRIYRFLSIAPARTSDI
jgi:hypothetical protein